MGKVTVMGDVDYVMGHLRYGHYELEMDEEVFKNMTKEDTMSKLREEGEFIVDDTEIEDIGSITEIRLA